MRITIVGPAYPLRGGIAHHTYWLRQELAARGHTVQVVSFRKLYPRLLFPGSTEIDNSRMKLDAGALAILTPLSPITWLTAFRRIREFAPEVVVFQWWQPFFGPLVGTLARGLRRIGVKLVIECHNILPHEGSPLDRQLLEFAFSPADQLITHSRCDQQAAAGVAPGKPVAVCALPTLAEFSGRSSPSRAGRTILFFGKVRKYKGLPVLLEALPRVLQRFDCRLVIVGEFYDPIHKYHRLVRQLGIADNVSIDHRYVPNEEVPAILEQADVLVLPYLSASSSGVAQIAFSNALPVIASSAGGLSEAVIDGVNGLVFPSGDSDALAEQIIRYFADELGPVFSGNLRASTTEPAIEIVEILESLAASPRVASGAAKMRAGIF
ncbi:MAG TPA: glycosyltransferase [Blastocatellia bacterium]|nr:glycosyltransferase [Blastocatellia bacterium]